MKSKKEDSLDSVEPWDIHISDSDVKKVYKGNNLVSQIYKQKQGLYYDDIVTDKLLALYDIPHITHSSTILTDVSGNGNNASMTGFNLDSWQVDGSLRFNGTNNLITTPLFQDTIFNNQKGASIEVIIKVDSKINYRGIWGKHYPATGIMSEFNNNTFAWGFFDGTENKFDRINATAIPNNYIHLIFTYDRNMIKLNLNGSLLSNKTIGIVNNIKHDNICLGVGNPITATNPYFLGNVKLFSIYEKALSVDEVSQNYNAYLGSGYL